MPAPASSLIHPALSHLTSAAPEVSVMDEGDCTDLRERLAVVPDPRGRRGIRHTVGAVLAVAAAAVAAGARSFAAIG